MEEIRIDITKQSADELALASRHAQLVFRDNAVVGATRVENKTMTMIK